MPSMGSFVYSTQPRKESVNLKIGQQKLPKLKCKEKNKFKKNNIQKLWGDIKMCSIFVIGIPEEKREWGKINI